MKSLNVEESIVGVTHVTPEKIQEHEKIKKINEKLRCNEDVDLREVLSIDFTTYEKLMTKYEDLKNLFTYYSKIGDKFKTFKIELTSFLRFVKDMELIENHKGDNLNQSRMNITHKSLDQSSTLSPSKRLLGHTSNNKVNSGKGYLNETDVSLIFFSLTGKYI